MKPNPALSHEERGEGVPLVLLHAMPLRLQAPPRIVSLFWHQRNDTVPAQRWLRETLVGMFARSD